MDQKKIIQFHWYRCILVMMRKYGKGPSTYYVILKSNILPHPFSLLATFTLTHLPQTLPPDHDALYLRVQWILGKTPRGVGFFFHFSDEASSKKNPTPPGVFPNLVNLRGKMKMRGATQPQKWG